MAIVTVENLSKRYHRVRAQKGLSTVSDALLGAIQRRLRRTVQRSADDDFWALRDVNLKVELGDVIGIIGRNGAGKSTLLKLLSRITEPTSGRIRICGRLASLLEVGTGFHPELSGRENIFLNGAMLGMSRREIRSKFDEIVAFSEIEDFLDTPVKRYSSGMYVRLAFSVAAHLEPEILVVDEVLAVGDFAFQKKCLGKMGEVSRQGRTVLFVSHNLAAVENLCNRGVLLNQGRLVYDGSVGEAIRHYLHGLTGAPSQGYDLRHAAGRPAQYRPLATSIEFRDNSDAPLPGIVALGQTLRVRIGVDLPVAIANPEIGIGFDTLFGQRLFTLSTAMDSRWEMASAEGELWLNCEIADFPLAAGEYRIRVFVRGNGQLVDLIDDAACIQVVDADFYGTGRKPYGLFAQRASWRNCTHPLAESLP